jgi:hypothetical protein
MNVSYKLCGEWSRYFYREADGKRPGHSFSTAFPSSECISQCWSRRREIHLIARPGFDILPGQAKEFSYTFDHLAQ